MKPLLFLLLAGVVAVGSGRRIRVRPVGGGAVEGSQQVEYYAEQEEDEGPVLVSRQDTYGRATGQSRLQPKLKPEAARAPPVQTIRNYNKLNDDGSFTFGYEAADGSFKEETRGTDCVVRGKYGYIDPDGNKREFTYVSGNPCDPNAVHQEEEEELPDSGEENIPQNLPRRPLRPVNIPPPRPTTVFQQDYSREVEEDRRVLTPRPAIQAVAQAPARPVAAGPGYGRFPVPTFAQLEEEIRPQVLSRPVPTSRPKPVLLSATPAPRPQHAVSITPRPRPHADPPATTFRPQILVTSTPAAKSARPPTSPSTPSDLEQELKNFQLEHNVVSTPRPAPKKLVPANQPIYTSELVFDPSSGQYNTVVYQQLPQTQGDFSLRGRLQPFVAPQAYYQPRQPYAARPQPQYPSQQQQYPSQQQLFANQQASLVQQSQQLFAAQQQRKHHQKPLTQSLLQQEPQRFAVAAATPKPFAASQPYYFVAQDGRGLGQIDAFLRGHSIPL